MHPIAQWHKANNGVETNAVILHLFNVVFGLFAWLQLNITAEPMDTSGRNAYPDEKYDDFKLDVWDKKKHIMMCWQQFINIPSMINIAMLFWKPASIKNGT